MHPIMSVRSFVAANHVAAVNHPKMRRNHMRMPIRPAITEITCNTFDNFMFLLWTSGYLNYLPNAAGRLRIDVDQSGRSECPLWRQNAKTSQ